MSIPTTPGALTRARAWIANTVGSNDRATRRVAGGSLLAALLASVAVALAGADAQAAGPARTASAADCDDKRAIFVKTRGRWRCQNLYMARVTLDARDQPGESREGARIDAIEAGEFITISCQVYAFDKNTGKRLGLYDMLPGGEFIPDKYVRTRWIGRIPGAPTCDPQGGGRWRPVPR
jgi:hypothetical protein